MSEPNLDPSQILQVGMGFWPAKTVLSAVELELFTELSSEAMTGEEIGERVGLHPRGIYDFLDTLVALGFPRARRERIGGSLPQYPRDCHVPRQAQANLRWRHPRDEQLAALSLLGRSHRGAPNRPASERDQTHWPADVRRALQRPGEARAIHGRDDRCLEAQLHGAGREVRLLALRDGL